VVNLSPALRALVPASYQPVLIIKDGCARGVANLYVNDMDSNVGRLSELVMTLAVTNEPSIGPFFWSNVFTTAMPSVAGAKVLMVKILLPPEQRAVETAHRRVKGWDARRGTEMELRFAARESYARVRDQMDRPVLEARLGAVTTWDAARGLPGFLRALHSAKVPFPKRATVNEFPMVIPRVGRSPLRETTMYIKGNLLYRPWRPRCDRICFDKQSELGALLHSVGFEPQIVIAGDGLRGVCR
jgi:hypothetical protein